MKQIAKLDNEEVKVFVVEILNLIHNKKIIIDVQNDSDF